MGKDTNDNSIVDGHSSRMPWFCILSSFYIAPYFDLSNKKGKQFLEELAKNIFSSPISSVDTHNPIDLAPWYVSNFDHFFVGLTDSLHRYNDPGVMSCILYFLGSHAIQEEKSQNASLNTKILKQNLEKAIADLNLSRTHEFSLLPLPGNEKKGRSLLQKHWLQCFESILFDTTDTDFLNIIEKKYDAISHNSSEDEMIIATNTKLASITQTAVGRYTKHASAWQEQLKYTLQQSGKDHLPITYQTWNDFRTIDSFYSEAKSFFVNWWQQDFGNLKSILIQYCQSFQSGRYTEQFSRIEGKTYPAALTTLPSALFVTEELMTFVAKILRDGPGIIVYPTPNLGTKKSNSETPFTVLRTILQEDQKFVSRMTELHGTITYPYLTYTYIDKKESQYPAIEPLSEKPSEVLAADHELTLDRAPSIPEEEILKNAFWQIANEIVKSNETNGTFPETLIDLATNVIQLLGNSPSFSRKQQPILSSTNSIILSKKLPVSMAMNPSLQNLSNNNPLC